MGFTLRFYFIVKRYQIERILWMDSTSLLYKPLFLLPIPNSRRRVAQPTTECNAVDLLAAERDAGIE